MTLISITAETMPLMNVSLLTSNCAATLTVCISSLMIPNYVSSKSLHPEC